jgi:Ino eighty subunit 1
MRYLSETEQNQENVDTQEEIEWGRKMTAQRNLFLQRLVASVESDKKSKNPALPHFVPGTLFSISLCSMALAHPALP